MIYVWATVVVLAVFLIGRQVGQSLLRADMVAVAKAAAEERGQAAALAALKKIDATGSTARVHDVAGEMSLADFSEDDRAVAEVAIGSYRRNLPVATLKVAWEEKVRG